MLTCKKSFITAGIVFLSAAVFCMSVFAQAVEMPSMPTVSMPEMPTISSPGMDGKFYKPSLPNQKKNDSNKNDNGSADSKATETVITNGTTTEDILTSLLTNANLLSASDISDLYDTGSFNTISSLSKGTTDASTNILLRQILEELNELKKEHNTASAAQQEIYAAKKQDSETFKTRNPSILRFKINGYNIKDSVIQTFFSEPEADGSFLLTGDRKYFLNNKVCNETFYMLFKAVKSNGSTTTFSVTPSIAQASENKSSYVYKLCQCSNMIAEKTGNLVVIHFIGDDITADLLLDIDK